MGEASKGLSSVPAQLAAQATPPAALPLPRMHGRRILLKLAARGGMGDVYLAATTGLEGAERPCIVKTVRRDHMHDGSFLARFLDEARVQAQLQHPGVAQVLEAATEEDGQPYTVVEYVEGRSLSDLRQRSIQVGARIAWADAVAIAIEIAMALAHVHDRAGADGSPLGIVHRDLSPQNVMVSYAGEVKLIDFGTARGLNRRCKTVAGVVFAKPGYVAPEVARQQVGDGRIDLYALGIMLWELCSGRRFLAGDPQKHLDDVASARVPVPPIAAQCGGPPGLDAVIANLTKNDPDERYARASAAVGELARILTSAPVVEGAERGVRSRVAAMMRKLWPHEPARSRTEFARLLRDANETLSQAPSETPAAGPVSAAIARCMTPADPSHLPGTPYRLGKKIGEGGSGTVYEAEHVELARKLAVKILGPDHAASPVALERFRREARAVANLSHPNLVQLFDFGSSLDGRTYLAMELCPGETLDARLRGGPIGWREAAQVAIEATRALEAAHAAGLVHRDLKPQNLMLTTPAGGDERASGERGTGVKLLDFGVATALSDGDRRPMSDREKALGGFSVFGTPEYMAPEQVAGDAVDGRADLYALGCVLYEMLTGAAPFEGSSSVTVMGKQLRDTPEPPRVRAPLRPIPRAIDQVVVCAMRKAPAERFPSAGAMRAALEEVLAAPERRLARVRQFAGALAMGVALVVATVGSARWGRAHAVALDAPASGTSSASGGDTSVALGSPPATGPHAVDGATTPAPSPASSGAASSAAAPTSLRDARLAARARPSSPRALEAWTRAALRAGDFHEAHRAVSAWTLHDSSVEPRIVLADILDASGRRGDGIAVLEEWIASHPDAEPARASLLRLTTPTPPPTPPVAAGDAEGDPLAKR